MQLLPSEIYRLGYFEEATGILHELAENDGIIVAHIGKIHLALPLEMEESLRQLISQRITILRTDIPEKSYLFRLLDQEPISHE